MKRITKEELKELLNANEGKVDLSNTLIEGMDLCGWNLQGVNFERCDFRNVQLKGADLSGVSAENAYFQGLDLTDVRFCKAFLKGADFRNCNLSYVDLSGADVYSAAFYKADLTGLKTDEDTKNFFPKCPMEGAFIGWKVCYGRRIVQLLVPRDAKRLQGTREEIRVDKAKVLSIRSADYKESYEEAHAYVDEEFIYRRKEMVYAKNFHPDRFVDSGGGIHIWLDRESAIAYLG